ncbi:hypothetical protein A2U01_0005434, partial [Trifolium medium]|nr:hypothetical protein [Trifolium medium]
AVLAMVKAAFDTIDFEIQEISAFRTRTDFGDRINFETLKEPAERHILVQYIPVKFDKDESLREQAAASSRIEQLLAILVGRLPPPNGA